MSGTLNLQGPPPLVMPTGAAAGYVLTTDGSGNVSPQPAAAVAALVPSASVQTSAHTGASGEHARVDASAGNVPVTPPTAPANNTTVGVKQIAVSLGVYATTVTCGGSDALNKTGGGTSYTLTLPSQGAIFQYNTAGAYWLVTADNLSLAQTDKRYLNKSSPMNYGAVGDGVANDDTAVHAAFTAAYAVQGIVDLGSYRSEEHT